MASGSDDLAEPWLRGVDTAQTPLLRPTITVREMPVIIPRLGWGAAVLAAILALPLGSLLFGTERLTYAVIWAGVTVSCHALACGRVSALRRLGAAALSGQAIALILERSISMWRSDPGSKTPSSSPSPPSWRCRPLSPRAPWLPGTPREPTGTRRKPPRLGPWLSWLIGCSPAPAGRQNG